MADQDPNPPPEGGVGADAALSARMEDLRSRVEEARTGAEARARSAAIGVSPSRRTTAALGGLVSLAVVGAVSSVVINSAATHGKLTSEAPPATSGGPAKGSATGTGPLGATNDGSSGSSGSSGAAAHPSTSTPTTTTTIGPASPGTTGQVSPPAPFTSPTTPAVPAVPFVPAVSPSLTGAIGPAFSISGPTSAGPTSTLPPITVPSITVPPGSLPTTTLPSTTLPSITVPTTVPAPAAHRRAAPALGLTVIDVAAVESAPPRPHHPHHVAGDAHHAKEHDGKS